MTQPRLHPLAHVKTVPLHQQPLTAAPADFQQIFHASKTVFLDLSWLHL